MASDPATAHSPASATKPRTKKITNQPATGAITSRMSAWPVASSPSSDAAAITTICESASTVLPITLPHSSARIGTAAARISTTRLSFSCTTLCAIIMPKPSAVM